MGCSHSCGGSILDASTILNAAHCVSTTAVSNFLFVAGEHSLSQVSGFEQSRGITGYVMHENYNTPTNYHDIALFFVIAIPFSRVWLALNSINGEAVDRFGSC